MKLVLITLLLAISAGYLLGGRLSNLALMRVAWAPLAIAGLAMQVFDPPGSWPLVMLIGSFVLLSAFAIKNRRIPGFAPILIGVALNFLVIGANRGMPVSGQALSASRQMNTIGELTDNADSYVKHHLAGDDDRLLFLGDVIGIAPPVAQAISIGDIFTYGGVAVVIAAGMRRRTIEPGPSDDGGTVIAEVPGVSR